MGNGGWGRNRGRSDEKNVFRGMKLWLNLWCEEDVGEGLGGLNVWERKVMKEVREFDLIKWFKECG